MAVLICMQSTVDENFILKNMALIFVKIPDLYAKQMKITNHARILASEMMTRMSERPASSLCRVYLHHKCMCFPRPSSWQWHGDVPVVHRDVKAGRGVPKRAPEVDGVAWAPGEQEGEPATAGTHELVAAAVGVGEREQLVHQAVAAEGVQLLVQPPGLQHDAAQLVHLAVHQGLPPRPGQLRQPPDAGDQQAVAPQVPRHHLLQHPVRQPHLPFVHSFDEMNGSFRFQAVIFT